MMSCVESLPRAGRLLYNGQPTDVGFHHSNGCRLAEVTTRDLQMLQVTYNCQKIGHLANNCLEPHRQRARNDISEVDISDLVAKTVNTALNARETKGKAKEEAKADF